MTCPSARPRRTQVDQYEETKASTMKGTLIYSEIRGLHLLDHGRTLHELHQNVTRPGLKLYKNLLAMSLTTRYWAAADTPSNGTLRSHSRVLAKMSSKYEAVSE